MNTNQKGNIGLIKVIADLYAKQFTCFLPFDDYNPVDCVALNNSGKPFRIQIKYKSPERYGSYIIKAYSVVNGKIVPIDKNLIDYWAIYFADKDLVMYMDVRAMIKKSKHINLSKLGELGEWLKPIPC